MSRACHMIVSTDVVRLMQAVRDREEKKAQSAGQYPAYEFDLLVFIGKRVAMVLMILLLGFMVTVWRRS